MKFFAAISLFVLLAVGVTLGRDGVQAQTTLQPLSQLPDPALISATGSAAIAGDASGLSAADYAAQLTSLQTLSINQLTIYRKDAQTYQTAKDQYYQLQTLASLEEAIKQTRQVMLTRLTVLQTYFSTARLTLQYTKGIDTQVKNTTLQQLDALVADLKQHQIAVAAATDRPSLLAVAVQFVPLNQRISDLSAFMADLVTYGNLQAVTDKTVTIKQELQVQVEQTVADPLVLAEKKRGLDEVQRNLDQVTPVVQKIRSALDPANLTSGHFNTSTFANDFSTVYGGLTRSLVFLQELVKNI